MQLSDFCIGQRVELHPGTDRWMMGDRFATVKRVGRKVLTVEFDRSGQLRNVHPSGIGRIM